MAVGTLLLPGLLVACDGSPSDKINTSAPSVTAEPTNPVPAEQFTGYEEFVTEYEAAVSALTPSLPDDVQIDLTPRGDWDPDGQYEPGSGEMQAAFEWQCAWIEAYVDAKGRSDRTATDGALQQLSGWTALAEVAPHIDGQSKQIWADDVIGAAMKGDDEFLMSLTEDCA